MKYILALLLFLSFAIISCEPPVTHGPETISFFDAWAYVVTVTSYWVWLGLTAAVAFIGGFLIYKNYSKYQDWKILHSLIAFILAALFLFALLYQPAETAANTTVEQAARGVYIW